MNETHSESIEQKINRETARIHWSELQTHFAAGNLISVDAELDLIVVARAMTNDDATPRINKPVYGKKITANFGL